MEEDRGLNLALAISSSDYERSLDARSRKASLKSDFDYALRLQQDEYAKQRANEPESSSSKSSPIARHSNKKTPFSRMRKAVSNALGNVTKVCDGCQKRIYGVAQVSEGKFYHPECYRRYVHESCCICRQPLPHIGNRIAWCEHPFWKQKFCHAHNQDGTQRCCSCERLKPIDVRWIALNDGREICNECSHTMIVDDVGAQELYNNILGFYASMSLYLPARPPLMLVDRHALNERSLHDPHHGGSSQTRGMTVAEEYRRISNVIQQDRRFLGQVYSAFPVEQRECRVACILVLGGLPYLLTGSILAHEVMHVFLKLTNNRTLDSKIEEGLCQLMAYLWIEQQTPEDSFRQRLCSFIASQIREHPSPVYGEGFRTALECFQTYGLPNLINHVRQTGQFPGL